MAIRRTQRGFALFIAIIFMSVMLSFGLALSSLAYKQQILASNSIESQYAFYAADSALECALYADQQQNLFTPYPASDPGLGGTPDFSCDATSEVSKSSNWSSSQWIVTERFSLDSSTRCADVTIYKYANQQPDGSYTRIYVQGYDASCTTVASPSSARFASRGVSTHY
jgi:hypothetical protein